MKTEFPFPGSILWSLVSISPGAEELQQFPEVVDPPRALGRAGGGHPHAHQLRRGRGDGPARAGCLLREPWHPHDCPVGRGPGHVKVPQR